MDLPRNLILQGDALEVLRTLPDDSVDCAITSPPYWSLRDYGSTVVSIYGGDPQCEHEWRTERTERPNSSGGHTEWAKGFIDRGSEYADYHDRATYSEYCTKCDAWRGQLGLEPTFNEYISHLCDIYEEVKRVLKPTGTCWVNLGDTYYGGGRNKGGNWEDMTVKQRTVRGTKSQDRAMLHQWAGELPDKCLTMIPFRFAIEMVNRGWISRNTLIWHKPNAMPRSVTDRFTVDFEYIFFFTKSKKYWFEQQMEMALGYDGRKDTKMKGSQKYNAAVVPGAKPHTMDLRGHERWKLDELGKQIRNKRAVWSIPTKPFKAAHFATYPEKLMEPIIKAGCPAEICSVCGKPREKIKKKVGRVQQHWAPGTDVKTEQASGKHGSTSTLVSGYKNVYQEEGYSDCGCGAGFKPGVVLDIFIGSGTTAVVAERLGRDWLGIELNPDYIKIATERVEDARQ